MDRNFACMLHLVGEQPLPIYIGVLQFECPFHILAVTEKTRSVGEAIRDQAPEGLVIELMGVPAYDVLKAAGIIAVLLTKRAHKSWCFNLTGGTKPMFAAALQAAREAHIPAYYVDSRNKTLDWLTPVDESDTVRVRLNPAVQNVATFIRLAGYEANLDFAAQMAQSATEMSPIIAECWGNRTHIEKFYRVLSQHSRYPGVPFKEGRHDGKGFYAELKGPPDYEGALMLAGRKYVHAPWMDLAQFAAGGWFEAFVWLQMETLIKNGKIWDRLFRVSPMAMTTGGNDVVQEFDVAATDGFYLSIIECKAGEVKQEHIQKLENITRRFGGHFGRGVVLFAEKRKINRATVERIKSSNIICAVSAARLENNPACVMEAQPGHILS